MVGKYYKPKHQIIPDGNLPKAFLEGSGFCPSNHSSCPNNYTGGFCPSGYHLCVFIYHI